jgi:hypothetical protein
VFLREKPRGSFQKVRPKLSLAEQAADGCTLRLGCRYRSVILKWAFHSVECLDSQITTFSL